MKYSYSDDTWSNNDLTSNDETNSLKTQIKSVAELSGAIGGTSLALYGINSNDKAREMFNSLPGASYMAKQHQARQASSSTLRGMGIEDIKHQDIRKSILSMLQSLEEISPMHLLRTMQFSNIYQPFAKLTNTDPVKITAETLKGNQFFYEKLLEFTAVESQNKVKRLLKAEDLKLGVFFHKNKLYGANAAGKMNVDDLILNNARLVYSNVKNGNTYSYNQILSHYADIIGGKINREAAMVDPVMVIGARNGYDFGFQWARSLARYTVTSGARSLDNPITGIEEMLGTFGLGHTSFLQSRAWNTLKSHANIRLGTNGVYNLSTRETLTTMGKNLGVKSLVGYVAYQTADSIVRNITPEGSLFHDGIFTGLAGLYTGGKVEFAKLWSDRFQGYKERQEQAAPGSTSLLTLAGIPLAGSLLGANYSYAKRLRDVKKLGWEAATDLHTTKTTSNLLSKIGINKEFTQFSRNTLIGSLLGVALISPFIPGALIGKSSEELKDEYSGKKDVENRANRLWFFGGQSVHGEHIKNYQKSWYARLKGDAQTKTLYGNDKTKKKLDPILHPLDFIRNPYQLEQKHQDDMPYPVWGMNVTYGSVFGKVFEKTVGHVIKPDIINPRMQQYEVQVDNKKKANANHDIDLRAVQGLPQSNLTPDEIFNKNNKRTEYAIDRPETEKDQALIDSGLMLRRPSAQYTPGKEGAAQGYNNFIDLVGIKGWATNQAIEATGFRPNEVTPQLARSGEINNFARNIKDSNMGDILGMGDYQRKLVGTMSDSLYDRVNPLKNKMPDWLPHDPRRFYKDFSRGNPYQVVENGAERLPGAGYEKLNPELKGLDPKDYPLINQFKILSDVAFRSPEQVDVERKLTSLAKANKLSDKDIHTMYDIQEQNRKKLQKKKFYEYSTDEQRSQMGSVQKAANSYWQFLAHHSETAIESLTPLRPGAKLIHQRSAIEDYQKTELGGSDVAIWTNPYAHFIKPTYNKIRQLLSFSTYKPSEAIKKDQIDEYFDKLSYMKARKNNNLFGAQRTVVGSAYSGLNTKKKVEDFRNALTTDEKDYFDSFSREKDAKKRKKILEMLPSDLARNYQQIWHNVDIATQARDKHASIEAALLEDYHAQTVRLEKIFGSKVKLTKDEEDLAKSKIKNTKNKQQYAERLQSITDGMKRQKMSDLEATAYIKASTGVPSDKYVGWDPRLTTNDIKIKTLSVGDEDLKKHGFWARDEERMRRLTVLDTDNEVATKLSQIKKVIRSQQDLKQAISNAMFDKGFKASKIDVSSANQGTVIIKQNKQN